MININGKQLPGQPSAMKESIAIETTTLLFVQIDPLISRVWGGMVAIFTLKLLLGTFLLDKYNHGTLHSEMKVVEQDQLPVSVLNHNHAAEVLHCLTKDDRE